MCMEGSGSSIPYRKMLCYAVSAPGLEAECPIHSGICSSSIKERKSKCMQGGRWLQESQKIAQEGITLPGTPDRLDFLLPMWPGERQTSLSWPPFFFLEPLSTNLDSHSLKRDVLLQSFEAVCHTDEKDEQGAADESKHLSAARIKKIKIKK